MARVQYTVALVVHADDALVVANNQRLSVGARVGWLVRVVRLAGVARQHATQIWYISGESIVHALALHHLLDDRLLA